MDFFGFRKSVADEPSLYLLSRISPRDGQLPEYIPITLVPKGGYETVDQKLEIAAQREALEEGPYPSRCPP